MKTQKQPKYNADGLLESIVRRAMGERIKSLKIGGVDINLRPFGEFKVMYSDGDWVIQCDKGGILCSLPDVRFDEFITISLDKGEIAYISWDTIKITFNTPNQSNDE